MVKHGHEHRELQNARELANRVRARAAMAALDQRNPNLDDFVGLNWSFWADRVNVLSSDARSKVEDDKYGMNCSETMTLGKEDMHIYGHCPAHDDFYLVVCSQCGQVVKPQAFERHCERWHGPVTKLRDSSSALAPQQLTCSSLALSNVSSCMERQKEGRCQKGSASSAASPAHQHRSTKTHKKTVSFSSVKFPGENPHFLHHSSSMPCLSPLHSAPLPADNCSSSILSESPSVQRFTAGQSTESHCPLRGIRTYSRINKNIQKKECELNKHSRVLDPERKKLCSRETDSVKHQQEVLGQTETTDQLSVEQRTTSASDHDTEKLHDKSKHQKKHVEGFGEKMKNKYTSCHILRNPAESLSKEEGNGTVEVEVQPPYPFNQSLLSSDDSEDNEPDEATDLPATPWHPKPLGLCTFGCRTLGCSIFTFDRRLHHLQFALSAMLERHVSTHLWKKMPQVSSLRSRSLSLESTSLVQFETNPCQPNSYSIKPPYPAISASVGSGRLCFPRKAQLIEVEPMQRASTAQKATKKLQSSEDKASTYIRDPSFKEKGQPQQPDSATCSNGKKPRESTETQPSDLKKCRPFPVPNHRSARSRGKLPGDQQKVVGYDHMSVAQKRKSSSELLT